MRKYLVILPGLFFLFSGLVSSQAIAEAKKARHGVSVTSKRQRKNARYLFLAENLKSDKKKVYTKFGYTPHRLRFDAAGVITERWRYYGDGLEFVFDEDSNLIEWRKIKYEDRRIE